MSQEVRLLKLEDLVLWTENPRDPINDKATDQDIVNIAMEDKLSKWSLSKLAKNMGDHYDFSELPTIVFHGNKPVVYDGNRRVILGKIKNKLVSVDTASNIKIPDFPNEIPCNVCSKSLALKNVLRKHADTGSWLPLERDIFLHKHMKEKKSLFLIIEESTGIISANPHLNQRFVKEEIFTDDVLKKMGISFIEDKLYSKSSDAQTIEILMDISRKVYEKTISTRSNRGKAIEVLDPSSQEIIGESKSNKSHELNSKPKNININENTEATPKQSRRVRSKNIEFFGGPLYLRIGGVSNLYRDIVDLHRFYCTEKDSLSEVFPCLVRMSLRLLCESAAKDCNQEMSKYLEQRFQKAKNTLDKDIKTTLSNCNVTEKSLVQLLHTGAHNYGAAANMEQTIAVSVILGAILTDSHGKTVSK